MPNTIDHDQRALLEAFKRYLHLEDTSTNTISAYLSDLSHFMHWYILGFQEFEIDAVTPTDTRDYWESLQEQVPPVSTVGHTVVLAS